MKAVIAPLACLALASARLLPPREERPARALPAARDELPCGTPTTRGKVEFPDGMIVGGAGDFAMYSGYINVTETDYLFYWLFEAQTNADDAPLVIWSNGGPGCSAMEGATTEHGPYVLYDVKEAGATMFGGKLTKNPHAFNKRAHVVYVDQPRYVGYSAGTGAYVTSSEAAGEDLVAFLLGFRAAFPEHAARDIIFASESYGGHYAPAWTGAVLDYNDAQAAAGGAPLPLVGVLVGNGITNSTVQNGATFAAFAKESGLIAADSPISTEAAARAAMTDALGYEFNYYDYRVKSEDACCGCMGYDYKTWADWHLRADVLAALHVCGDAGDKAFAGCAAGCIDFPGGFDEHDAYPYSLQLERALDRGVNVTFYYGKDDTACNFVGGRALAGSLEFAGADAFAAAEFVEHAGFQAKSGEGLTFVQVDASSHMVPIQQGAAASFALDSLIS